MKRLDFCVKFIILSAFSFTSNCLHDLDSPDGGWKDTDPTQLLAGPGPCNIDVINVRQTSFSQQNFIDNYAYTKPVIIKEATNNKRLQYFSQRHKLLRKYGDRKIRLSSANTYSYRKRDMRLVKYVNEFMRPQTLEKMGNETFYMFGDNNYTEWEDLFARYVPPPYTLPYMEGVYSFGIASAGTGVPFHFHGPTFGETIFGRKRWFLYPPEKQPAFDPNKTTLHWLLEEYDNLHPADKPIECTLNPGEIIYFPDRWWHGTLNIDTSVFMSTFLG